MKVRGHASGLFCPNGGGLFGGGLSVKGMIPANEGIPIGG
jgi:hypothetical protein